MLISGFRLGPSNTNVIFQTKESFNSQGDGRKSDSFSTAFSTVVFNLKFKRLNRDLIINASEYTSLLVEGFPVPFSVPGRRKKTHC